MKLKNHYLLGTYIKKIRLFHICNGAIMITQRISVVFEVSAYEVDLQKKTGIGGLFVRSSVDHRFADFFRSADGIIGKTGVYRYEVRSGQRVCAGTVKKSLG